MVFLKPTILRTESSAERLTGDRYDYIMGLQGTKSGSAAKMPDFAIAPEAPVQAPQPSKSAP